MTKRREHEGIRSATFFRPQAAQPSTLQPSATNRRWIARVGLFLSWAVLLLNAGCGPPERTVSPAFYHWQTELDLTETERQYLEQLNARTLYVKFFDVDWDEARQQAVPLAVLQMTAPPPDSLEIIPTVFITNRTFSQLPETTVDTLARRIRDKIFELAADFAHPPVREIQIDCDWSQSTRAAYFRLLDRLRQELQPQGILLSVTIRLHQVRYREQTGVPPAGRGLLMCYNTGEVTDWNEPNSILRRATAAPYLDRLDAYPLPLDLGLPVFHWGVLFRDGQMIRLINNLDTADLADRTRFTPLGENRYEVRQSTFLQGYYLYQGDRLRLEAAELQTLREVTALLANRWPTPDFRLAFYHLDTTNLHRFSPGELMELLGGMGGSHDLGNVH